VRGIGIEVEPVRPDTTLSVGDLLTPAARDGVVLSRMVLEGDDVVVDMVPLEVLGDWAVLLLLDDPGGTMANYVRVVAPSGAEGWVYRSWLNRL